MSILADRFDIAEVKRASVRFKGALQAEWQEMQKVGFTPVDTADFVDFSQPINPAVDLAVAALPRVNFSLSYKDESLRGNSSTGFFGPLKVSNWEH